MLVILRKMYFLPKWLVVIMLFVLKLNCSDSKTLIDRNKGDFVVIANDGGGVAGGSGGGSTAVDVAADSDKTDSDAPATFLWPNGSFNYDNNKENKPIVVNNSSGVVSDHVIDDNRSGNVGASQAMLNTTLTALAIVAPALQLALQRRANLTNSFYYELLSPVEPEVSTTTAQPAGSIYIEYLKNLTGLPSMDDLHMNFTLSPPTDSSIANTTAANVTDDDSHFSLSNTLFNSINQSDVDHYLVRYESDGGTHCLLDDVKEQLMWWCFSNGTLREANLNMKMRGTGFLDLSFSNCTQDERLYNKVKATSYSSGSTTGPVIVFSAAHNNLTSAPHKTLTLMNDTLMYLSLMGNQFTATNTEKQMENISRKLNDTYRHPNCTDKSNDDIKHTDHMEKLNDDVQARHHINDKCNTPTSHSNTNPNTNTHTSQEEHKQRSEPGINWATFPQLPNLIELDISNCHIEFVTVGAFQNFPNLRRLFMSHNKMRTIPSDTFEHMPALQYLDLSHTNVLGYDYQIPLPTLQVVANMVYGVKIQQSAFKHLAELVYLDLSHTKVTRNSAMAFTHLGEKLKFLSLCYTSLPMLGNAFFRNTGLLALDLSGNPYAAYNKINDAFEGVSDTLQYLYFERSNIKDLSWLKYLDNLKVLGLSGNNINLLTLEILSPLRSLQILDLSSNHVGNWYNSAFGDNKQLRVLNLRDNNINIITSEMLKDFQTLEYLSMGANNFVCDCLLKDLVEVAATNNRDAECGRNVLLEAQQLITTNIDLVATYLRPSLKAVRERVRYGVLRRDNASANVDVDDPNVTDESQHLGLDLEQYIKAAMFVPYVKQLESSQYHIKQYRESSRNFRLRFISPLASNALPYTSSSSLPCSQTESLLTYSKLNGTSLKFQLLDYEEESYWCFNETERLNFVQLQCQTRTYSSSEEIAEKLHKLTTYAVGSVCGMMALVLIGVVVYLKRWHIFYYYSSLKSAALVSVATKDSVDKFNTLAEQDPNLVYDIFISYCQNDRQWVLEELLPNVEETGDISICMHERDFQIGLTILDNIISCMDRSRALMLIISSNFLLSHWCQFEMHLAQHRIFEVSKEHLILVFLEDIPRSKRPRTLQYLMEVKTYIKWPTASGNKTVKPEERKLFWKRMKRSLENIRMSSYESNA